MTQDTEGAFEEARRLLEAEANRRGISGEELVDRLAREGRCRVLADVDPQDNLSQWTATVADPGGTTKSTDGAVILGTMSSGKTNATDLTRARLVAEGVAFQEETRTGADGREYVEFSFERPENGQ